MKISQKKLMSSTTGFDMAQGSIKPKLLENRVTQDERFFQLSDGFKKVFSNDRAD